jgi:formylglycine-generating enzyme required for sulfatase activity
MGLRLILCVAFLTQSAAMAALADPVPAGPGSQADWASQRRAQFAQWRAAHPRLEPAIEELKRRTREMVEQRRREIRAQAEERLAGVTAKSRQLSADQRREVQALLDQGTAAAKSGRCAEGMPQFRRVLELDPARAAAAVAMGECLRSQGDLIQAADYFTQAAALPPLDPEVEAARLRAMLALQSLPQPHDPRVGDPPVLLRVEHAPAELWDAPEAPVMTIIPAGEFTMGSPPGELYADPQETQHRVSIGYPLAVEKYNVTRGEFAAFVRATGYAASDGGGCNVYVNGGFRKDARADWRSPGFDQSDDDPVVCVNYDDAVAYTKWLTQRTGHNYRLPSEAEFEYAVRAGATTAYSWGPEVGAGHANCDGCSGGASLKRTTPGGAFPPNGFGLYDMSGNVWKWLADCWNRTYEGAPRDGSAWESGNCALRVRRSGSWFNLTAPKPGDPREPGRLRAASRFGSIPDLRFSSFGFRVVRDL